LRVNEAASARMQQENDENNKVADSHKNKDDKEKSGSPSLNMNELRELADLIDEYGLVDFEFENANIRVHMRKQMPQAAAPQYIPAPAQAAPTTPVAVPHTGAASPETEAVPAENPAIKNRITSPIVGTFYEAPSPDSPPFVKVGDKVKVGQVVCIVEAMKLMNEIESEFDGEVIEIYPANAQAVEYGEPLFAIG